MLTSLLLGIWYIINPCACLSSCILCEDKCVYVCACVCVSAACTRLRACLCTAPPPPPALLFRRFVSCRRGVHVPQFVRHSVVSRAWACVCVSKKLYTEFKVCVRVCVCVSFAYFNLRVACRGSVYRLCCSNKMENE